MEISPEALADWSLGALVSPLDLLEGLYWTESFALPGRSGGYFLELIERIIQQLKENAPLIEDTWVASHVNTVIPELEAFARAAHGVREWVETNFSKKMRAVHHQAVRQGGPQIPPWHDNPDYQLIFQKSTAAFARYLDVLSLAIPVIRERLSPDSLASYSVQLDRASERLPDLRLVLKVGYPEAFRIRAGERGVLPPA